MASPLRLAPPGGLWPWPAAGHPTLLVRSPYPNALPDAFGGLFKALFEKDYVLVLQNERGSEWSERRTS